MPPARSTRRRPAAARPRPGPPPPPPRPTPITLGELGTVELADVATTGYARTNGQPSLTLTVTKTSAANTVQVAEAVQDKLDEIAGRHHGEIDVRPCPDLSDFIMESQDGLVREGGLGRAVRGPHDLPVPVQHPLDAGRRDQHPAVGARPRWW